MYIAKPIIHHFISELFGGQYMMARKKRKSDFGYFWRLPKVTPAER